MIIRKLLTFVVLGFLLLQSVKAENFYFVTDPSISPDGSYTLFVRRGDIWKVSTDGGEATRITAMRGDETKPRISPDGKWITFSSNQSGNKDVYVMPAKGGEIKKLSFHSASDVVTSWSWDSKSIYFTSDRYNLVATYKVSLKGGTPVRMLGDHYHSNPHAMVENPLTDEVYFTDSWESGRFMHRKRYKGANNPDIKSFNLKTKQLKQHTTYEGKDLSPIFDKKGNLYFVSDQKNGEYNLCKINGGKIEYLTSYRTSINLPQISADGSKIVFVKDYSLYVFDTKSKKSKKIKIRLADNDELVSNKSFNTNGNIRYFDISSDKKKIVFVSRGELFVSDIKGKFVKQLPTTKDERVTEAIWCKDSKTILFTQTVKGWANLFTIKADGSEAAKQITKVNENIRNLSSNKDKTKAIYFSGRNGIKVIDLKKFKEELSISDELWGFNNDKPMFSPCGNYLLYSAFRNFEKDIFVYDLKKKKKINLTMTGVTEESPYWSPCGKYIYFSTDRYKAKFPRWNVSPEIYRIALDRFEGDFRNDKFNKLFEEPDTTKKDKTKKKPEINSEINLANITDRWERVYVKGGKQYSPRIVQKKETTRILFGSDHTGQFGLWQIIRKPFEKEELKQIKGIKYVNQYVVVGDKQYILSKGNIHELKLSGNKTDKIEIKHTFQRNMRREFTQMFYETWATLQENFYDETFHGVNWEAKKAQYEKFLPYVGSRKDLRILLNEMLGELNASHLGFSSNGDENRPYYKSTTRFTGIMFSNDKPYVVDRVVRRSPADKRNVKLQKGDELIEVNGTKVDKKQNRNSYFTNSDVPGETYMKFKRGKEVFEVKLHAWGWYSAVNLLYNEWIDRNQKRVDDKTNNRVAYAFMKDMSGGSLNRFLIDMTNELYRKDALILDLRYNRGGNIHDDVLKFLSQRPYLQWKYREGKMSPQPNFAPAGKPIVLLINQQSLSDAEMTTAGFKKLGLGKVIGTETYRWIIFTSGKSLVDGSYCRLPAWGCYSLNGRNLELTGEKPDIYIKNTIKDKYLNKDPQLDKAIEEILKQL